jgi:hypothetical protein
MNDKHFFVLISDNLLNCKDDSELVGYDKIESK